MRPTFAPGFRKPHGALIALAGTPTTGGNTGSSSTTVNLPSGIVVGEMLFMWIGIGSGQGVTTPTGWTLLLLSTSGYARIGLYYRVATGTEGTSIVVSHGNSDTAYIVTRIAAQKNNTPQGAVAFGASANPAPPSLTPSWGSQYALWFACASGAQGNTSPLAGYATLATCVAGAINMNICWLAVFAASESPPAFTASAGNWSAATIAAY